MMMETQEDREIKAATARVHAEWVSVVQKIHDGEIPDTPVALLFVGWALKDFVRDNNVAAMGNKEFGLAVDALLREQGYCIARLDQEQGA